MTCRTLFLWAALLTCLSALCVDAVKAQPGPTDEQITHIRSLAERREYDEALETIRMLPAENQAEFTVRLLKLKILSWAAYYEDADAEASQLKRDFPNDPDVQVAAAYLAYYQGNTQTARGQFEQVLVAYPEYDDAQRGLARVEVLEAASQDDQLPETAFQSDSSTYRVDYGTEVSTFDRSQNDDWTYSFIQGTRQSNRGAYFIRLERYDRFGREDVSITAGMARRLGEKWDSTISLGVTPEADIRPDVSFKLAVGRTARSAFSDMHRVRLAVRSSLDRYGDESIVTMAPGLTYSFANEASLRTDAILVDQPGEDIEVGAMGRIDMPIIERLSGTLGYADAPETVSGVVIRTETIFGGVRLQLSDKHAIRIDASRDDRDNSFIRETLSVSLSHRF